MIKRKADIGSVKQKVTALLGKDVAVKVNLGRNKYTFYKGKISAVYPALFTVLPLGDFKGKTTYSYSEMLCGNVFLKNLSAVKPQTKQ